MKSVYIFAALSALYVVGDATLGCGGCDEYMWGYYPHTFDNYVVHADYITPKGIKYDPSGLNISPFLIDRLTDEVESCLESEFPDGNLPDSITRISGSDCVNSNIHFPIDRSSFSVKIDNNWILSCDQSQQLLPITTSDDSGCIEKGLTPTQQCPCRWRAGIECPNKLIVPPSFYIYKDVLIRFVGGCKNPWGSTALAKCATPSTTPLSDGSNPYDGLQ